MRKLHVTPGCSAAGALIVALREAGRHESVVFFPDDLSCGPINPGDPQQRAEWWGFDANESDIAARLHEFWDRIAAIDKELIVLWFGRHSSAELAFYLAMADRLLDRSYDVVDVTGLRHLRTGRDGKPILTQPAQAVGSTGQDALKSLLDQHQPINEAQKQSAAYAWRALQRENAPFRIVTAVGLASAPSDNFDGLLLERATSEWRTAARVIGDAFGHNCEPYLQVSDYKLHDRLIALVESGQLLAEGDIRDMRASRVRLPDRP